MKISRVVATWIMVTLIVGALTVSACYRSHTPAERADWMANKISKDLALDDQQKQKLDAVKQEYLRAHAEMRQRHEAILDGNYGANTRRPTRSAKVATTLRATSGVDEPSRAVYVEQGVRAPWSAHAATKIAGGRAIGPIARAHACA
jgi:hypothetical protein